MCSQGCSRCDFDTHHPNDIVRPLCRPSANLLFLTYRAIVAVYFTVFLVVHLSSNIIGVVGLKIFIYLSDWTFILVTLYLVIAFLNGLADYVYHQRHGSYASWDLHDVSPILYRFQWLLFSVGSLSSFLICASYWPTVGVNLAPNKLTENFNLHALPSIVLFIDLIVTAVPSRFCHVVYVLGYGAVYLVFAAIYWAAGGTDAFGHHYIYNILNFNDPKTAGLVVLVEVVGALAFQWLVCGITLLRDTIAKECHCGGSSQSNEELPLTQVATGNGGPMVHYG